MASITFDRVTKRFDESVAVSELSLDVSDGEFLVLVGTFQSNTWAAFLATTGIILGATYMLYLYRRVIFGELEKPSLKAIPDMGAREIAILAPLVVLTIFFGFHPAPILDVTAASVKKLVTQYEASVRTQSAEVRR